MKEKNRDIYDPVNDLITQHIEKGSFTLNELENAIREINGPMRVAPAYTVKEYLDELVADGTLEEVDFIKKEYVYIVNSDLILTP